MIKRNAPNECFCVSGSQIYQWIRQEKTPISSMLRSTELLIGFGLGVANALTVEGFLALGTAIGIGMVAVLIKVGWLQ